MEESKADSEMRVEKLQHNSSSFIIRGHDHLILLRERNSITWLYFRKVGCYLHDHVATALTVFPFLAISDVAYFGSWKCGQGVRFSRLFSLPVVTTLFVNPTSPRSRCFRLFCPSDFRLSRRLVKAAPFGSWIGWCECLRNPSTKACPCQLEESGVILCFLGQSNKWAGLAAVATFLFFSGVQGNKHPSCDM